MRANSGGCELDLLARPRRGAEGIGARQGLIRALARALAILSFGIYLSFVKGCLLAYSLAWLAVKIWMRTPGRWLRGVLQCATVCRVAVVEVCVCAGSAINSIIGGVRCRVQVFVGVVF